jgi:hypothetical protein
MARPATRARGREKLPISTGSFCAAGARDGAFGSRTAGCDAQEPRTRLCQPIEEFLGQSSNVCMSSPILTHVGWRRPKLWSSVS